MEIFATFTVFDWIVVALVGFMALGGLMRGFTHEALSLTGWILAIIAVRMFHEPVTTWLVPKTGGEASAAIVGFLGVFFGTVFLARLVAGMAGGFAKNSLLGPMDRLLGLGFGALKALILSSVLFLLAQFSTGLFDAQQRSPDWLMQSRSAPLLSMAANTMVGWVKEIDRQTDTASSEAPMIPPGHPGNTGPQWQPAPKKEQGYSRKDRDALEDLLEAGASDEVVI